MAGFRSLYVEQSESDAYRRIRGPSSPPTNGEDLVSMLIMAEMLETLTREMFEEQLEGKFVVSAEGLTLDTQLIDCRPLTADAQQGRREPFSVLFRGPMEPLLEQQIYEMSNKTIGELEIFLVPIGPDDTGMRYEAVFT